MTPTLLLLIGGLGYNQFRSYPHILPTPASGDILDTVYLDDAGYIVGHLPDVFSPATRFKMRYPACRIVAASHSMGWISGKHLALAGYLDQMICVDPVGVTFVSHDRWPMIKTYRVSDMDPAMEVESEKPQAGVLFRAQPSLGIHPLDLEVPPAVLQYHLDCGHNEAVGRPEVAAAIRAAVLGS